MLNITDSPVFSSHFHRILVVDDDPNIRSMVRQKLNNAGYEAYEAASGREALAVIDHRGLPHLAVVDLMMPGMDGFEFCEHVQNFSDLPVIMLTAVDEEESIIHGLRHFAEDYVTKPFSPRELVVRIERVLRRIKDFGYTAGSSIDVDDRLSIDFVHQHALADSTEIHLTPTETKLLYILMRNARQVITTDFLLQRLWPLEEMYEDTLRVHIRRLRKKIEATPSQPIYIVTERGLGYRFVPPSRR